MKQKSMVLIAEDDADSGEMLETLLEISGFTSQLVTSAAEAVDSISKNAHDVVLLDLTLPGLTSQAMIAAIAELPVKPPIVIYSARPKPDLQLAADRMGARCFLQKPAALDDILGALRGCLG